VPKKSRATKKKHTQRQMLQRTKSRQIQATSAVVLWMPRKKSAKIPWRNTGRNRTESLNRPQIPVTANKILPASSRAKAKQFLLLLRTTVACDQQRANWRTLRCFLIFVRRNAPPRRRRAVSPRDRSSASGGDRPVAAPRTGPARITVTWAATSGCQRARLASASAAIGAGPLSPIATTGPSPALPSAPRPRTSASGGGKQEAAPRMGPARSTVTWAATSGFLPGLPGTASARAAPRRRNRIATTTLLLARRCAQTSRHLLP